MMIRLKREEEVDRPRKQNGATPEGAEAAEVQPEVTTKGKYACAVCGEPIFINKGAYRCIGYDIPSMADIKVCRSCFTTENVEIVRRARPKAAIVTGLKKMHFSDTQPSHDDAWGDV